MLIKMSGSLSLSHAIRIFVESALLYTSWVAICLITELVNTNWNYAISDIVSNCTSSRIEHHTNVRCSHTDYGASRHMLRPDHHTHLYRRLDGDGGGVCWNMAGCRPWGRQHHIRSRAFFRLDVYGGIGDTKCNDIRCQESDGVGGRESFRSYIMTPLQPHPLPLRS